ncbi:hypothetical protein VST7929_02884 [Vibrio stylophorae]|uniref:Uncharacterized protein n=1 Tax=Vibrio stylophorae TaxID=659351 RepID=A0ABM8ZX46_9VIBR|nr:hypothetical protein VST7929_02884 [Vibrio stylophorae]
MPENQKAKMLSYVFFLLIFVMLIGGILLN